MPSKLNLHQLAERLTVERLCWLAAAIPLFVVAWTCNGYYGPIAHYDGLEHAHLIAFGYGVVGPLEQVGAESPVYAAIIGLFLRVADLIGIDSGLGIARVARLCASIVAVFGLWFAARIAITARGKNTEGISLLVIAMAVTSPVYLYFGTQIFNEAAAGTLIVIAAALLGLVRSGPDAGGNQTSASPTSRLALAGAALAGAVHLHAMAILIAAVMLLVFAYREEWRTLRVACVAFLIAFVTIGLSEAVIADGVFATLRGSVGYNIFRGGLKLRGAQPWHAYVVGLVKVGGIAAPAVALLWLLAARKHRALVVVPLIYLVTMSGVEHKAFRFALLVWPLMIAGAAVTASELIGRVRERRTRIVAWAIPCILFLGLGLERSWNFDASVLHNRRSDKPISPWRLGEEFHRAMSWVGEQEDLCGVIVARRWDWTGGLTYLHRDVPVYFQATHDPEAQGASNYILVAAEKDRPDASHHDTYVLVDESEGVRIYRRDGDCLAPGGWVDRQLPTFAGRYPEQGDAEFPAHKPLKGTTRQASPAEKKRRKREAERKKKELEKERREAEEREEAEESNGAPETAPAE